eukprot:TRINITY_DN12363_c0_g1_i1.p1 TRINITY_DN12363_c0_g1~~TRINITY_DN12363_c0_g1_i1.p1  ORF type:complete len:384 (-),score=33.98 TRINITY_DN12363_c0_g1_i1:8-1159(-)
MSHSPPHFRLGHPQLFVSPLASQYAGKSPDKPVTPSLVSPTQSPFFRHHWEFGNENLSKRQNRLEVISGATNLELAAAVCRLLGLTEPSCNSSVFANGEMDIKIQKDVRGADVYLIQSLSQTPATSINGALMELLLMVHTLRLASAGRITAVVPYLAYSRQDAKREGRVPMACAAVSTMLTTMGVDRVITVDLHSGQAQGFFLKIPVDNLYSLKEFAVYLHGRYPQATNLCVVAPAAARVERARVLADRLGGCPIATIMRRHGAEKILQLVGEVRNRHCILIDDIIDSGATLWECIILLKDQGVSCITACITHGLFGDKSVLTKLNEMDCLNDVIVTDTVPQHDNVALCGKLHVLSVATMLAESIARVHNESSLSELFTDYDK